MRLADFVTTDPARGTMTMHYATAPAPMTHRRRINRLRARRAARRRDWELAPHTRANMWALIADAMADVFSSSPIGRGAHLTVKPVDEAKGETTRGSRAPGAPVPAWVPRTVTIDTAR